MTERAARRLRVGFTAAWLGCLALAARATATAHDTHPEHLLGLLPVVYMAAWAPYFLFHGARAAGTAARFVLCTGSILLAVGSFELLAVMGAVDYRAVFATPTPPWRRPGNGPDRELIYVKEGPRTTRLEFRGAELSRMRGALPGRVYRCDLQLDAHGFRNPPGLRSAEVIVVGDSFIEGLQVAADELVTTRLSGLLGKPVANLGRTSYGPQQELEVLRRFGLGYSPRTCVWAFYEGNDLQDLNAYESESAVAARDLARGPSGSRYERSLVRNGLAYAIRNWIRPDPSLPAGLHAGRLVDPSGRPHELYFATGSQHGEEGPRLPRDESTPEVQKLLAIVGKARDLCSRSGIDLVVAFVPSKFRVYRETCRFAPGSPCLTWPIDDLPRELETAIRRRWPDLRFVDLTPGLHGAAARGSIVYLADDTHWSAEGHRLAAELIAGCLATGPPSDPAARRTARLTAGTNGTPDSRTWAFEMSRNY